MNNYEQRTDGSVDTSNGSIEEQFRELSRTSRLADLIIDHIENGAVVVDHRGFILYFNRPYANFLGIDRDKVIGMHVTEVIKGTRMHLVAKTGIPEFNHYFSMKGRDMVVQRIPVFVEGKVVAVFGQVMFKNVGDVGRLANTLKDLETKVRLYEEELTSLRSTRYSFESIKGDSTAICALKGDALKAASTDLPVLITGESGTGKELFAQAIHHASPRCNKASIHINCAAIPKELFESELFGYAKGAFTGAATGGKPGKLELAHGGTLFLDEIGEMPLDLQPKLLRVLEDKMFERVGGNAVIKSDFRLIAATNRNLEEMVATNHFRGDLYYRLNVVSLAVPPLRERREDIIPLARYLMEKIAENYPGFKYRLTPQAEKILTNYHWPGNIRELANVLERTIFSLKGNTLDACDLPFCLSRPTKAVPQQSQWSLDEVVAQAERDVIRKALELTENNKAKAADLLGIHRTVLYKKLNRYRIPLG